VSECLVSDLGGLPMIDDNVKLSAIATLACAVRQGLDQKQQPLASYLQPELARECYRNACAQLVTELDSVEPTKKDMRIIQQACDAIVAIVPEWEAHFSIPLRWRRLITDILSSSNPIIPQHIYLGQSGIYGNRLAEQIIHELSHTWVGMIAEIVPLALPGEPIHTLPSGTMNKEIRQVVYALTFSATAVRYYRKRIAVSQNYPDDIERLKYLERYTDGCLKIVETSDKLLINGTHMAASCRRILYS